MRESTREFLRDLQGQFHNDYISAEDMQKAHEQQKRYDNYAAQQKAAAAQEEARLKRLWNHEQTAEERKISDDAIKEMLKPINEEIKRNQVREANFWDNFYKHNAAQEGREEIERLLEIAQERNDYLSGRLREAEAQENEELIAQYTQQKAENDKNLELYRGKYEEYKAAAEG